jgi:5-formyltetrahydrofolate cyclo-ligase
MLGFDNRMRRIGYGGGFYDRTFENKPNILKIGVAFEFMKVDCIPIEPNDVDMDFIVTEEHVYKKSDLKFASSHI